MRLMMAEPKVIVGIPTFNRAAWLGEAIESVLAQNSTDFRLLVSDNASDDETPEVVRSFQDFPPRTVYLRSTTNIALANLNRLGDDGGQRVHPPAGG